MTRPSPGDDGGQAAVELALVLPVVFVLLVAVVQVGLVVRDQVLVVHAAREVARELAVREEGDEPAQSDVRQLAVKAAGNALDPARLTIETARHHARVNVRVGYRAPIRVPLLENLARDVAIAANAQARREIN